MRNISVVLFLILFFVSCQPDLGEPYLYKKQFAQYLQEVHHTQLTDYDDGYIVVLPINECSPCMQSHILPFMKVKPKQNITVIIAGDVKNNEHKTIINQIKTKYNTLHDSIKNIDFYEVDCRVPTILKIENDGITIQYKETQACTWKDLQSILNS